MHRFNSFLLFSLFGLFAKQNLLAEELVYYGLLDSKSLSTTVSGDVEVLRDSVKNTDYIVLYDFVIKGGIIPHIKICGDVDVGAPFEGICISTWGEPPAKGTHYRVRIPAEPFLSYSKIVIIDLELGQQMGGADLTMR